LELQKAHVALNGLKGKEKLEVPAHISERIYEEVYGIPAPKQLAAVKIKSMATITTTAKKELSVATPTPTTPVTPVIEAQIIRAPLESQDSIRSKPDSSDYASDASQEKAESALVNMSRIPVIPVQTNTIIPIVTNTIIEDEEPGCFYCGGAPSLANFRFKDLTNSVKYPYLVIRRLLGKKKRSVNLIL